MHSFDHSNKAMRQKVRLWTKVRGRRIGVYSNGGVLDFPRSDSHMLLRPANSLQQTIQQLLQQEFIPQGHLCELDTEALAGDDVPNDGVRPYGSTRHLKS
jgi:hypothetical protein